MTTPPSSSSQFELRQMRRFTAREKRDALYAWRKLFWRKRTSRWYTVAATCEYGFASFLALSVLMSVNSLSDIAPALSGQLALSAAGYAISAAVARWLTVRLHVDRYWEAERVGDRYLITAEGIQAILFRGRYECSWDRIEAVLNDDRHVLAKMPGSGGILLVKAAFEGQDVDEFGAALVRRWQDHRASSATEP
jgi:hypothetical protein